MHVKGVYFLSSKLNITIFGGGGGNFEDQWEGAQYLSDDCHFYAVQYVFNLIKHIFSYGFLSFSEKKFSLATLKLLKCYSAAML